MSLRHSMAGVSGAVCVSVLLILSTPVSGADYSAAQTGSVNITFQVPVAPEPPAPEPSTPELEPELDLTPAPDTVAREVPLPVAPSVPEAQPEPEVSPLPAPSPAPTPTPELPPAPVHEEPKPEGVSAEPTETPVASPEEPESVPAPAPENEEGTVQE